MENIRNFSIIAHIDHGKSTLADRFLEITNTIPKEKLTEQHLDRMELERERGITIKLAPVSMNWRRYKLNLIDTPGHVDFSYEVFRSLSCVEGAILLVDATKGVEAQTLSNLLLAKEQNLKIIPVINKIDLPNALIEEVKEQLISSLGFNENEIYQVSAKLGTGVEKLLTDVSEKIPAPAGDPTSPLKALVFDSFFDSFKGVIAYVRVFGGKLAVGDKIKFLGTGEEAEVVSLGFFSPELVEKESLAAGEIGWIATGLKAFASSSGREEVQKVKVGDTIAHLNTDAQPLPGYKEYKPMVFAGLFPVEAVDFPRLKEALEKLKLNDAALIFEPESFPALGFGMRAGFLGPLHMEIVQERLEREFDLALVVSSPTVRYKVIKTGGQETVVSNPGALPESTVIKKIFEPWVKGTIISNKKYLGGILELVNARKARVTNIEYFVDKVKISCALPLREIIFQFYDQMKTVSSGYASFDYEFKDYEPVEAVKLEILVAKQSVDALSQIVPKEKAYQVGKALVEKLKEAIPRQQFEVSLQAAIGGKIIAAARIPPFRKDVTAKLYGGDRTRKDKLLQKQRAGKRRMKMVGRVEIPQEAFLAALKL